MRFVDGYEFTGRGAGFEVHAHADFEQDTRGIDIDKGAREIDNGNSAGFERGTGCGTLEVEEGFKEV